MVKNAREALFIACEMEKRAIKMYQRGAMICPHMKDILAGYELEERSHLERFSQMGAQLADAAPAEERLLLSARAEEILFPGGLMKASRDNAFADLPTFLAYAAGQEEQAVSTYREFARRCESEEARDMFLAIAAEETVHYEALVSRQNDV